MSPLALLLVAFTADPGFESTVLPVLVEHCYACHASTGKGPKGGLRLDVKDGAKTGGESGPAIVSGQPNLSLLVKAIRRVDGVAAMPPGKPLPAAAVKVIEAWVASGATDTRPASATHWAFMPPVKAPLPTAKTTPVGWDRHPIDRFVLQRLESAGLAPSPAADPRTLIRRVTFDLTGLSPTPEDVEAFVRDPTVEAYAKLVDRLLASPAYGERWARHWLDVVRFAESHGFETNTLRPNAWRYRDYVIRAWNTDLPYDRFVREQIAGDALGVDVATGFLVAGPWDEVKSPDPVLTATQRADELHDIVAVTGSAFLGLTVGCARCHDHKFDPVSHVDYHRLKAVFAGVRHGDRAILEPVDGRQELIAKLTSERAVLDQKLSALEPLADPTSTLPRRSTINSQRNVDRIVPSTAKWVRFTIQATYGQLEPCLDEFEIFTPAGKNVALATAGGKVRSSGNYGPSDLHKLEHAIDGRFGNSRSWISNQIGKGWLEVELAERTEIDRVVWARDREGKFTDRTPTIYRVEVATELGQWRLVASSDDRAALGTQPSVQSPNARDLIGKRTSLEKRLADLTTGPLAYAGQFTKPDAIRQLHRGDPMAPKDPVAPGAITSISPKLELSESTPEQARRVAFADWLTDPRNPLTARVIVNRLWHYHFGTGLVDSPSDFGRNGGLPSHPELLDWLAVDLVEQKWSLKSLHKLMVTSATYRQASRATDAGLKIDANDRLLWRYPPHRLEAEAIRDAILAVSGQLDRTPGGPGFDLFEPNGNYVKVYTPKREFGPETFRRMVYWAKPRMRPDDTFGPFDCPDAGQIAPRRSISTTPLQALSLLNSPFVVQQANHFAARVTTDAGSEIANQVRRAFRLALQRNPSEEEAITAKTLVASHGLAALCRALLNANEFVFVE